MENERLIVPAYIEPQPEYKPTARDYLAIAGIVIKTSFGLAKEFIKDPKGFIDKWSDDFAHEISDWMDYP
jgi:hypothetical protein